PTAWSRTVKFSSPMGIHDSIARSEEDRRQGRDGHLGTVVETVGGDVDRGDLTEVAEVAGAVELAGIGVEDLVPHPGGRQPDPQILMGSAREVDHTGDDITVAV